MESLRKKEREQEIQVHGKTSLLHKRYRFMLQVTCSEMRNHGNAEECVENKKTML